MQCNKGFINYIAGEDFGLDLHLPNIDFGTYVSKLRHVLGKIIFDMMCVVAYVSAVMVCLVLITK